VERAALNVATPLQCALYAVGARPVSVLQVFQWQRGRQRH